MIKEEDSIMEKDTMEETQDQQQDSVDSTKDYKIKLKAYMTII